MGDPLLQTSENGRNASRQKGKLNTFVLQFVGETLHTPKIMIMPKTKINESIPQLTRTW
jgi:hypothetical protein